MHDDSNIRWDDMLAGVMKEGRAVKKRRLIIRSSLVSLAVLLAAAYFYLHDPEKDTSQDLFAEIEQSSEIEVALINSDAFFDNDLELLIY